jgi:hypothetical protein
MQGIPRRYGHFVYGVVQFGLTCAVAAAIASFPFLQEGSFATHWAMGTCLGHHAAGRLVGAGGASHEKRNYMFATGDVILVIGAAVVGMLRPDIPLVIPTERN